MEKTQDSYLPARDPRVMHVMALTTKLTAINLNATIVLLRRQTSLSKFVVRSGKSLRPISILVIISLKTANVSQTLLHLLRWSRVSFHPINLRFPSKILTRASTFKLSYLRYSTPCLQIFTVTCQWNDLNIISKGREYALRNDFNVTGSPFEAIFAPQTTDASRIEGSSLENPIRLPGVKVDHFRSFLRILYPLCVFMIHSLKYWRD